jgi:Domain of Unknown Function (DUF1206)
METTAQGTARRFTRTPVFEALARAGYAARGIVYAVIGVLGFRLAEGVSGQPANQKGALRTVAHQPFGHWILLAVAIGLAGYAIWRATQAFVGVTPEAGEHSAFDRVGAFGSAIAYGSFCAIAIALLRGSSSGGSKSPSSTTAGVLGWPAGRQIVIGAGVVFLIVAAYQVYQGLSRKFLDDSKVVEMSRRERQAFTYVGVTGLLARGVVFGLIGVFAIKAARDYSPKDAVGLDGALASLLHHTYGSAVLVVVACGLIAFGAYSIADARFRKI